MGNQARGIVSEKINGEMVDLRIATNEWCELEDEHGKTTDEIAAEFMQMAASSKLKMGLMRSIFRAALSSARPGITHEEAGQIMADHGLVECAVLIGKVIMASMPEVTEPAGKSRAPRAKPARR